MKDCRLGCAGLFVFGGGGSLVELGVYWMGSTERCGMHRVKQSEDWYTIIPALIQLHECWHLGEICSAILGVCFWQAAGQEAIAVFRCKVDRMWEHRLEYLFRHVQISSGPSGYAGCSQLGCWARGERACHALRHENGQKPKRESLKRPGVSHVKYPPLYLLLTGTVRHSAA